MWYVGAPSMRLVNAVARRVLTPGLKDRIGSLLCDPRLGTVIARGFRDRIPSQGLRIDTSDRVVSPRTKAQIFWGIYESAEIRFVRRHLRRDLDVVELGSSLGVVACEIARRQDSGRRLLCVEANPALVPLIRRNVARNAPGHRVDVVQRAIDYDPNRREVTLGLGPTNVSGSTLREEPASPDAPRVPTSTLAALLAEQGIEEYALVSDIEGAEAGILLHDAEALASCRQLLIELHDVATPALRISADEMVDTLVEKHGFRLVGRHGVVCAFER